MKKHFAGFEKEPPQPNGPKSGGKPPIFHSHSMRPKRHHRGGSKIARKRPV